MAINKMLLSCFDEVRNARVDVQVDNQAVIHAWYNQGGRISELNNAMKVLFSTTVALNVLLHLRYVRSADNLADVPDTDLQRISALLIVCDKNKSSAGVWGFHGAHV